MRFLPALPRAFAACIITSALAIAFTTTLPAQTAEAKVQALSETFWDWRATEQPFTNDDIPRLARPAGYVGRWSPKDVAGYEARIAEFEKQWRALDVSAAPVPVQVDYRLIGSAIARVRWELEVIPDWKRNPFFYVDQGLTATYTLALEKAPISTARQHEIVLRLESIPRLLDEGRSNLTDMRQPYAAIAMGNLAQIETRMERFRDGVHSAAGFSPENLAAFDKAEEAAAKSLVAYREWLKPQVAGMKKETAVGREGYLYFLRNVALLPYTPEQILQDGEIEFQRAVGFEALQQAADKGMPELPVYPSLDAQIADEKKQELAMRKYLTDHGLLTGDPAGVKHYYYVPTPPYIGALGFLGVEDDLTNPMRLNEDGSSYKGTPRLGGFWANITSRDVRPLTNHEGMPGHYFQMAWSMHHPDPVRRHYYDSEAQEGIGFYAEEMMMIAGLYENTPKMKEAIYALNRLRTLRVAVDVKLALGEFTQPEAQAYMTKTVPMDEATARDESFMFACTPGQAITYQIGKMDILKGLTMAKLQQGDKFNLQAYQDFVWLNGSVPFSLQRWELLGDKSDVPAIPASFAWRAGTSPMKSPQSRK
ncbi:DUF885 family protein [Terriglobus roseus]|nr:DUF885 family protein [Terriglobus roseus]